MENEWDERHEAPIHRWNSIEDVALTTAARQRHTVLPDRGKHEELALEGLLLRRESPVLLVVLHGALDRTKFELPRFEWLRTVSGMRRENILFISDTTIELGDRLGLAWYIGTREDNLTNRLAEYIQKIAELLETTKIVLLGNSGGGYAALALGHRIPHSLAVAISPQTTVRKYLKWSYDLLQRTVFPESNSFEEVEATETSRFDLISLYQRPAAEGARFWYVQNSGDTFHVDGHWEPFKDSIGVSEDSVSGLEGRAHFTMLDWGKGHLGPNDALIKSILEQAISDSYRMNH